MKQNIIFIFTVAFAVSALCIPARATDPPEPFRGTIQSIVALDTVIDTGIQFVQRGDVTTAFHENVFWMYVEPEGPTDTLLFLRIDIPTRRIDSVHAIFPEMKKHLRSAGAISIAANETTIAVLFFQAVATFQRITPDLFVLGTFRNVLNNESIAIRPPGLLLARHYNRTPDEGAKPTEIQTVSLAIDTTYAETAPQFDYIEFTHFHPNHWIDAGDRNTLFAQTGAYSIAVMDQRLRTIATLTRDPKWWIPIDSAAFAPIRAMRIARPGHIRSLFDTMDVVDRKCSRVIAVHWLGDSSFVVRSQLPVTKFRGIATYVYDIWRYANGAWTCADSDLVDLNPGDTAICTRENQPLTPGYHDQFWSRDFMVVASPSVPMQRFGRMYAQIKTEEDDLIAVKEPTYQLFIYRIANRRTP